MSAVAEVIGVSGSNLHDRMNRKHHQTSAYHKAGDAAILPRIKRFVAKRPTYGYRRITAVLNRELRAAGLSSVNHKRVYRIMKANNLTSDVIRVGQKLKIPPAGAKVVETVQEPVVPAPAAPAPDAIPLAGSAPLRPGLLFTLEF